MNRILLKGFILSVILIIPMTMNAQKDRSSDLFKELKAKDSLLFNIGFNTCDLEQSTALMADDLEFYHDKSGITNSKLEFRKVMENGICRKDNPNKIYRFLVEESLEVFPMYDNGKLYGALQNGVHYFSPQKSLTFEESDNAAKFSHLWIIDENGEWKIKRVISYDHKSKPVQKTLHTVSLSSEELEVYSGQYKAPRTGDVTVGIKGGDLEIKAGQMNAVIVATSENTFTHPQAPLTFEFVKGNNGEVSKIIVRENGKIVEEATKQ